ncbi:FG-GAP-like repeat-containing protein [Rubripirellula lacrimiformis]|nr:FG-GAP-like repeat-containing protein [Rubripirellula lacrimiformis]
MSINSVAKWIPTGPLSASFYGALLLVGVFVSFPMGCRRSAEQDTGQTSNPKNEPEAVQTDPVAQFKAAATAGQWAQAEAMIPGVLILVPDDANLFELAGDVFTATGKPAQAVDVYSRSVDLRDQPSAALQDKIGKQWMVLGRPFDAVATLESIVADHPDHVAARTDLAGLLGSLGLQQRAKIHLQYLVQHQQAGLNEMIWLTDLNRPQTDAAICEYALKKHPNILLPNFALASTLAYTQQWNEARDLLDPLCDQQPDFVEAWGYLGRVLVEIGDEESVARWAASVPPNIESDFQYWMAAGIWSQQHGKIQAAAKAFSVASTIYPNDGEALNRLGTCLAELGRSDDARRALGRAEKITQLRDNVESLFSWRNHSQRAAVLIAESMNDLGRVWEAATWARIAVMMTQDPSPNARSVFDQIRGTMSGQTPWQTSDSQIAAAIDTSQFPMPSWDPLHTIAPEQPRSSSPLSSPFAASTIRFADEADQRQLKHTCRIRGSETGEGSLWIYQSNTGGIGVIDYDLDGWPDFYLTAADGDPLQSNSSPNRLWRNQTGQYVDVTDHSGTSETGYTQGIAVGDYNSDGFPDLWVGNFGTNRLLRNNGDGTFDDVTVASGIDGETWTSSLAIADLDGDSIADLFAVNYIGGTDVIDEKCFPHNSTVHRSCGPLVFPAQADRVWRGLGDGSFADASETWLTTSRPGRGLGLVAGMLDENPGMDIYVSNDMTANHFWSANLHPNPGDRQPDFHLVEQAAARGLAFNARSVSQASMGIAADDADNDGDIDFYLTHFTDDYNTLYLQTQPGVWADRTAASQMVDSTNAMLGFGTQWIDADNNGTLELAVANGNVDDFSSDGLAYRMPMQLFQRDSAMHFVLADPESVGPYFQSMRLGRALVTVDADRDRRVDMLVTHLYDPVSLLMNRSSVGDLGSHLQESEPAKEKANDSSRSVRFFLIATETHRDAVGTTVQISIDEQTRSHQRLAGNGYQCSAEPCLHFGIGGAAKVDRAEVVWPNGHSQSIDDLVADRDYLWVQGQAPTPLPPARR